MMMNDEDVLFTFLNVLNNYIDKAMNTNIGSFIMFILWNAFVMGIGCIFL